MGPSIPAAELGPIDAVLLSHDHHDDDLDPAGRGCCRPRAWWLPRCRARGGSVVIGFALAWEGQEHGVLWITGDTVLYDAVREVAERLTVDTALLHLGGVRFPVTGPLRYTMTAREAAELRGLVQPRTAIPIHYEGRGHFREGREAIEREFEGAPDEVRRSIRWAAARGAAAAKANP